MMNMNSPYKCLMAGWSRIASCVMQPRFAAACLIIVISWLPFMASLRDGKQGDVAVYESDAYNLMQGRMPYRDVLMEYPPYASLVFLLPPACGIHNYLDGFRLLAVACDMLIRGGLFCTGVWYTKSLRSLLPLIYYCAAVPFLKCIFLQRFDIWPSLVCVVAVLLFCADSFGGAGLAIAIGIGMKVYPAVFVPPLFILAFRQGKAWRFSAGLIAGLTPILLLSFFLPWWKFAQFQFDRGLQCESLAASLIWGLKQVGLTQASWTWVTRWMEVQGTLASALVVWVRVLLILVVCFSVAVASCAAAHCRKPSVGEIARLLLGPALGFVAFGPVLSPQYMIWLLPLAALGTLQGNPWILLGVPLATMLTPVIYPSLTGNYDTGLNSVETMVLVTRNLILVTVWWLLVNEQWRMCRNRDAGKNHLCPRQIIDVINSSNNGFV